MTKNVKFTTALPEETIKNLKIAAAKENTTSNQILIGLIDKYLSTYMKEFKKEEQEKQYEKEFQKKQVKLL